MRKFLATLLALVMTLAGADGPGFLGREQGDVSAP